MKKYYPVDFDENGNAVLGNAKSNPTSNGFIPTTWAPGGEAGNGIKSITISPAITTTPALDSLFPIYYEDLTEDQKQNGVTISCTRGDFTPDEYTLTVEPTGDWYAGIQGWSDSPQVSGKGESVTASTTPSPATQFTVVGLSDPNGEGDMVLVNITLNREQQV